MIEEYNSILKNNIWNIVLVEKSMIDFRWLYRINHVVDESIEKNKERFVSKGFTQNKEVDYLVAFSLVSSYVSIETNLAFVVGYVWFLY